MQANTFPPHPALSPYIRLFMSLQGYFPPSTPQHITPKGEPALFFPFSAPALFGRFILSDTVQSDMAKGLDRSILTGQSNTFALFNWLGDVNLIVVPLMPTGLSHFLRESANTVTNSCFSLEHLNMPSYFQDLQDKLWETDAPEVAKDLVEQYLLKHFYPAMARSLPTGIAAITNWINRHDGSLLVQELMKKFKVSRRRLEQQFASQIGLPPKEYSRVVRFRTVMQQVYQNPQTSWIRMVADFNYTDQSHLIRDFRQFAGVTPTVLSEERPVFDQVAYSKAFT